jgi:hypothetical protein
MPSKLLHTRNLKNCSSFVKNNLTHPSSWLTERDTAQRHAK